MKIKVLGTGCMKCKKLFDETEKALVTSGVEADIEKIENLEDIMKYGIMMTPALVIDEEVQCSGKIPKNAEIVNWIVSRAAKVQE